VTTLLKHKPKPQTKTAKPPRDQLLVKSEWTPLYHQLYVILRAKILNGDYREGDLLPGEFDLVELYGVSRITARRALSEIAKAGLAIRERGRGTRVLYVSDATVMRGPAQSEDVDEQKTKFISWEILSFGNVPAPASVSSALTLEPGMPVQEMARVLSYRKRPPYGVVTTYVILDIAGNWTKDDMRAQSLYGKIERSGTVIDQIDECVTACPADRALSGHLNVPVGTPLIKITRTMFAADNKPVEHVVSHYVPERYQYRTSLKRTGNRLSLKR
jgi:GntR family transcriptional regulator